MITKSQEKMIKSLQTKKGRQKTGLCLVEGKKVIQTAGKAVEFVFSKEDTPNFEKLITTETPQDIAGVAKIPNWSLKDVNKNKIVVVLDGVQDPGNVGTILRLCMGFDASLILVESADPGSPKVIRSSVGAMFDVPWVSIKREDATKILNELKKPIFRLEKRDSAKLDAKINEKLKKGAVIIAGSEGQGIVLKNDGVSIEIKHNPKLESLNVSSALAIVLSSIY